MSKEQSIDLDQKQLKLLEKIIDRHVPNKAVWVYGSRVTWKASQTSDLDLVVFDCAPIQIFDLKDAFEESDLLISVDVMDWERIPDNFKENIKRKYVVLQEKSELKNWQTVKIRDVADVVGGGTPSTKKPEYWGGKIPWLTPRDLSNFHGRYISKGERNISKLGLSKSSSKLVPKGAVLLTTRAPVGYLAIAENEVSTNQRFRSLIPNKKTNNLFLFYLLKHNVEYLKSQSSGTTFGELAGSTLKSLSFLFPPLSEQKAIAEVLSSLDDKIDLLHRQNKTLEDMAQTLFRQWFVEEADEGWQETGLLDIIEIIGGGTPKTTVAEYWDGDIPWLSGGDIASNHKTFANVTTKTISSDGLNNSSAKILPQYATVISARGTVGKYCLLSRPMAFSQSNYGVLPRYKECFFFSYLLLDHLVEKLNAASHGSVFDTITTATFKGIHFALPQENFIENFENSVRPSFKKILENSHQVRTLGTLRDALLPKVMNGEIRAI